MLFQQDNRYTKRTIWQKRLHQICIDHEFELSQNLDKIKANFD